MKVVKLNERQVVDAGIEVWKNWKTAVPYFDTVNPEYLFNSFENLVRLGTGRAYGLFTESPMGFCLERPVGILLGFIVPDLLTGKLQGIEYLWAVAPEHRTFKNSLALLKFFEADCKAEGCDRVLSGSSNWSNPDAMRVLYRREGYKLHAEAFSKQI